MIRVPHAIHCLLLLIAPCALAEFAPNLPVGTGLDLLLLRVSSRYRIDLPARVYLQPYTYAEVESVLRQIDSAGGMQRLSPAEKALVERVRRRFGAEKGLVSWRKKDDDLHLKVNLDLLGDVRPGFDDSAVIRLSGIARPSIAGNYRSLSFYSGLSVWTDYRSDTLYHRSSYQPFEGVAYNLY
jgi:hypothetical protein